MDVNQKRPDMSTWKWKRFQVADDVMAALHKIRWSKPYNNLSEVFDHIVRSTCMNNVVVSDQSISNGDIEIRPHRPLKMQPNPTTNEIHD